MSTNPEEHVVGLLSRWLARHVSDEELLSGLEATERPPGGERGEALAELVADLQAGRRRAELEVAVRETLAVFAGY
jgi:hypothetical protein